MKGNGRDNNNEPVHELQLNQLFLNFNVLNPYQMSIISFDNNSFRYKNALL